MKRFHLFFALSLAAAGLLRPLHAQNDIQVIGDAVFTPMEIAEGGYATYLVRFQNVGQDTVQNVVVRDTLDALLDINSLEIVASSHEYQLLRGNENIVRWYFNDVYLPDSASGGGSSIGFLMFTVRPKSFSAPGQTIPNRVCIIFDQIPTVCTNDALVWIDENANTGEPQAAMRIQVVPNPNHGYFAVQNLDDTQNTGTPASKATTQWWITDATGKMVWDGAVESVADVSQEVQLGRPAPGLYLLWVKDGAKLEVEQFTVIR